MDLEKKQLKKTIGYPKCFHFGSQYLPTSSFVIFKDSIKVCLFDYYDGLFVRASGADTDEHYWLTHKCEMVSYDRRKNKNIAYVRKYLENEEIIQIAQSFFKE